ncbi:MAG: GNAT family N-acetyltransferase [Candidatus Gottesmanbacteria bacterium]|nr:GNAT family N-acetyltransferase [Candidatus Gottesmanbacteria bacterium]
MKLGTVIKTFNSNKGNTIVLRYPKEDDLDAMLVFANELIAEDTFILLSGKPLTKEEEKKFLDDLLESIRKGETASLYAFCDGKLIGSASVRREKYRKSHVGIPGIAIIKQYREEGIGLILFNELIEQSKKMGLRLLTLECFEGNNRALHMYEQFGFRRVGVIPEAVLYKGKYIGEVVMYLPLV